MVRVLASLFGRRTDLPLDQDALGRFLPWLIAFMVYLAALALAGLFVLGSLVDKWESGISGTLTVQIAPSHKSSEDGPRLNTALKVLRSTPGIRRVEPISQSRVLGLLEPWLGGGSADDLPLPSLIDVELAPGAEVDVAALAERLGRAVPGASLDDHRVWLDRFIRLVETIEGLATAVLAFIGLATIGTVIFTTRTGLAIHHEAIEVLHLIGAQDSYIARQFAHRALALGLKGGLMGFALALPTLWGIGYLAARMEAAVLPQLTLDESALATLAVLPVAVAIIAMVTARLTVTNTLARML